MKRILTVLLFTALCVSLSACQPTPDKPYVESKNDGELESAIYGEAAPELKNGYEAPETWQESIDAGDGITTISVDANIIVPDAKMYPVYRVETAPYTDEDVEAFLQAMVGDAQLYAVSDTRTKSVILKSIENQLSLSEEHEARLMQWLNDGTVTAEEYEEMKASTADFGNIEKLRDEYKKAPDKPTITEIERKMVYRPAVPNQGDARFSLIGAANIDSDGINANLIVMRMEPEPPYGRGGQYMTFENLRPLVWFEGVGEGYNNRMCEGSEDIRDAEAMEKARELADEIVFERLGRSDFAFSRVTTKINRIFDESVDYYSYYVLEGHEPEEKEMYSFYYTPVIDGIPMHSYAIDPFASLSHTNFTAPHYIRVYVIDLQTEDYAVSIESSLVMKEKLNENVKLLPFDEIQDIFRRFIVMKADWSDNFGHEEGDVLQTTLNITDAELGYIRIPEKNNTDYGIVVPVWNFYGYQVSKYREGIFYQDVPGTLDENNEAVIEDDAGNAYLCINAIDGSIIDLNQGY